MRGRFIVVEGIDGSGKTTQVRRLVSALTRRGIRVRAIREPGATRVGERIRELLLSNRSRMSMACELFLYMAARAQLVSEKILPALREGTWVVCDRYLYSSAAYQGEAGGLGLDRVLRIGETAIGSALPDRVFLLDLDPREASERTPGKRADRIEKRGIDYQNKVRRGFLKLGKRLRGRMVVLDASLPADVIHIRMLECLNLANRTRR
jgi:dTMP kinase